VKRTRLTILGLLGSALALLITASAVHAGEAGGQEQDPPLVHDDAVVLGLLLAILAFVFGTSTNGSPGWKRFYTFVPPIFVCYFLPSIFTSTGVISPDHSNLYPVARDYLLPTSLVLLTLSIDFPAVKRLGPKALTLFLVGTASIVLGGPLAVVIVGVFQPQWVGGEGSESVWRGLTTVAGSWIGGGANQAAMKEVFAVGDIFSPMVAVDVIVANIWCACLLIIAGKSKQIDARLGADVGAIEDLKRRVADYQAQVSRIPRTADTMLVLAVGFGATALSHVAADILSPAFAGARWAEQLNLHSKFFWIVVTATTLGLALSFSRVRALEGVGASRLGTVCLYILVVTIGMKMDVRAVAAHPHLFLIGGVWMLFHAAAMIITCRLIRAPVFFMAVGSQANVGGAASAPIVASAFHPSLATVGVLLAVLGYALGTFGAYLCGKLMEAAVNGLGF